MEINYVFIDTETTAKVIFYNVITAVAQSFKHYKDERHISVVYNAASRIQPIEDLDEDDYKVIEQARIDYFVQKNPGEKENVYPEEIIKFYVIKNNDSYNVCTVIPSANAKYVIAIGKVYNEEKEFDESAITLHCMKYEDDKDLDKELGKYYKDIILETSREIAENICYAVTWVDDDGNPMMEYHV